MRIDEYTKQIRDLYHEAEEKKNAQITDLKAKKDAAEKKTEKLLTEKKKAEDSLDAEKAIDIDEKLQKMGRIVKIYTEQLEKLRSKDITHFTDNEKIRELKEGLKKEATEYAAESAKKIKACLLEFTKMEHEYLINEKEISGALQGAGIEKDAETRDILFDAEKLYNSYDMSYHFKKSEYTTNGLYTPL